MIENKLGILDLLDEESRLPNGQDKSLIQKFYKSFSGNEHKFFSKPRFGEVEFVIRHYAVDVTYQIEGFIDKNKDTVSDEQLEMLNQTKFDFFKKIIQIESHEELTPSSKGPSRKPKKPTLGSIFKGSLIKLMDTLRQTNPHYIRCIKPNQSKVAFEFEAQNVLGQLIACGVLETIKISRAGYPSKQSYNEFVNRYYLLVPSEFWKTEPRKLAERICASVIKGNDKYELGLTKVFFRAGQLAYLEKMRSIRLTKAVILIQKNVIRSYHQRRYTRLMAATKIVQQAWNDYLKMRDFVLNKKKYAAIAIQKTFRGFYARKKYKAALSLKRTQAVQQEKRNAEEAKRKADSLAAATASNGVLVDSAPLLKENEKLLDMIRKRDDQIAELMEVGNEKFSETIRKLENLVRKKDDQITTLTKENEDKSDEIKRLRETLKSAPKKIDGETALLKKEVSSLREQLSRVVASKYRSERSTEKFFNNDIDSKSASKLAPVHQINRMSMQFFNSAANVTARVAETLSRGETAETRPIRVRPIEIGDESVPKERAVRMLEATDLHEEIFDSLITNLRIPLPSAQTIATKKEIFFPAHLLGYLLTELLRNKMFDTLKEIFSQVIRGNGYG
jgi:myosin-5